MVDDATTGIGEWTIDNGELTIDNCFNLAGQRVDGDAKGIVIVGGKKIIK